MKFKEVYFLTSENQLTDSFEFLSSYQTTFRLITERTVNIYLIRFWSSYLLTAVAQWLRCCATIRKVTGSITAGVSGFFSLT